MSKISALAAWCFEHQEPLDKQNTKCVLEDTEWKMYLHGHCIAKQDVNTHVLKVTDAGYPTRTTHSRLNALEGVHVYVKKGQSYLNEVPWDGKWAIVS